MVTFSDAVKICLTQKYATMSGRASRSEFWWFQLFILVTNAAIFAISQPFGKDGVNYSIVVCVIFNLLTIIPYLSVFVRRLHDRNISGQIFWLSLLISIAGVLLVGLIINIFKGNQGPNKYGPAPNSSTPEDGKPQFNNNNTKGLSDNPPLTPIIAHPDMVAPASPAGQNDIRFMPPEYRKVAQEERENHRSERDSGTQIDREKPLIDTLGEPVPSIPHFCRYCGKSVEYSDGAYCRHCGKRLV